MTPGDFEKQVQRMESQWPRTYGQERKALLWQAMKDVHPEDFQSAVDSCLASHRAPPLLEQLSTEVDQARVRRSQNSARGVGGMYETLDTAAKNNKTADPEFVQACLKHLRSFLSGQIDRKQFDEGCGYLDDVARKLDPRGSREPTTAMACVPRRPSVRDRYATGGEND
jgi:hypothetical protein